MIIDGQSRLENNAAITVTRVSSNTYDLMVAGRDPGNNGGNLWLIGVVGTAFTAAGAGTLTCDLVGDDNAALASPTVLQTLLPVTGKATLVAGYEMFKVQLPLSKITEQYLGLNWTVATGPMTAGTVKVFLVSNVDAQKYYPKGYVNY